MMPIPLIAPPPLPPGATASEMERYEKTLRAYEVDRLRREKQLALEVNIVIGGAIVAFLILAAGFIVVLVK